MPLERQLSTVRVEQLALPIPPLPPLQMKKLPRNKHEKELSHRIESFSTYKTILNIKQFVKKQVFNDLLVVVTFKQHVATH